MLTFSKKKTKNATNWAINVWVEWAEQRNCNPTTAMEDYTCTYLRNSFNHDHIKKKSLKGTFSFYLFGLFK
jgi:hypothetical protein